MKARLLHFQLGPETHFLPSHPREEQSTSLAVVTGGTCQGLALLRGVGGGGGTESCGSTDKTQ